MSQRDEIKRRKKKQKKMDFTPYIIIGVVTILVLAVVILSTFKPVGNILEPVLHRVTDVDGANMGDPNAPVKVIEFADFQCPACGAYWSTTEKTIIEQYVKTGQVYYTFSPFSFLGRYGSDKNWDESIKAAEAVFCANDQGKFWDYRDYVFANQQGENKGAFSRERLLAFADKLELDKTLFKNCLDSDQYEQAVTDANQFAEDNGVTFTPSFSVNGQVVDAGQLIETIDAALAK